MKKIVPVIIAGGKGTRLWPLSRSTAPKQFIKLTGETTLFQTTLERVANADIYQPAIIITNSDFRFLVAEQAREIGASITSIVLEPMARNTAAAIAAAGIIVGNRFGQDAIMQVLASDHEIVADAAYFSAIDVARKAADQGKLVTFGITPTEPATGYGYIEVGRPLFDGAHHVARFVEKPSREVAETMLAAGDYVWNSGMFMFPVGVLLSEIRKFEPAVHDAVENSVSGVEEDLDFVRLEAEAFSQSPDISIDYAVMERTDQAVVVPSHFHWSDLGSWDQIWKTGQQDDSGNLAIGPTTLIDTQNSLVLSHGVHLAVQGLNGVAVIASEDAVYIGRLSDSQEVGKLVKKLSASTETSELTEKHLTSYRPWGGYSSVALGERFQVKRLFVHPGKRISLQKHHHRSEHWVVVKGIAEVTIEDTTTMVSENQSIYIPVGRMHRLYNPGKILLELIEIQTGSYLGEDDIVRTADDYGRN